MALVLIVDDSLLQRKIIGGIVSAEGHQVLEAVDGKDAFDKAIAKQPDCIISDLAMPNMDGFELLSALSASKLNMPVIVATADIQDDARQECLDLGALQVIHKPIKEAELLEGLAHMIAQKQEGR